jgi:hypothetical protein
MSLTFLGRGSSESRSRSLSANWLAVVGITVWLGCVAGGLKTLYDYQIRPGQSAESPARMPRSTAVKAEPARLTLVMFLHPHCPCSRASLGNLEQILSRSQGRMAAYVVFCVPRSGGEGWTSTDLCRSAAKMHGVNVVYDVGGAEARRFGAKTSGQVLLYAPDGRLSFSGGITAGRSHFGDNAGSDAILSVLRAERPQWRSTPVFGCALAN